MEVAEIARWLRIFFSLAGAGAGVLGIALTLVGYIVLAPALSALGESASSELSSLYNALGDAEATADSTSQAIEGIAPAADSASVALEAYGNSSEKLGAALSSLGDTFELVSALVPISDSTIGTLKSGAGLSTSAVAMKKAAADVKNVSIKASETAANAKRLKSDITIVKDGVLDAKDRVDGIFDALGKGLFLMMLIAFLFFGALIAYGIAAAL